MRIVLTVIADPHSEKTQIDDGTYLVRFPYPELTVHRAVVPEPYQAGMPKCIYVTGTAPHSYGYFDLPTDQIVYRTWNRDREIRNLIRVKPQ